VRVFLDTNVLVSAITTRGLCSDILNAILADHHLLVGEAVLGELDRVLREKMGVPSDTVEEADAFLRREAVVISQAPRLDIEVRDKDDEAILDEAVAGDARVLVTGDRDLLDIAADAPLLILDPRGFWNLLREIPIPEE
jgi:uncharacterized protein